MLRPVASFLRGLFGSSESHHCVLTPPQATLLAFLHYDCSTAQPRYLVILMSRPPLPQAKPDPSDDLVTEKRLSIPETQACVFLLHGARGALVSLCCSNTEQNQARLSHICLWSNTPLTSHSQHLPNTVTSSLQSPVLRATLELSSPQAPFPGMRGFPYWLQRHPRQGSTTEHEEKCLASHTDCLKRPSNQRVQRYFGNHLA